MVMDRTKSEIESENESLWRAIGKMRDLVDEIDRDNKILRENLKLAYEELDVVERHKQIIHNTHKTDVNRHVGVLNSWGKEIETRGEEIENQKVEIELILHELGEVRKKSLSGTRGNEEKAEKRKNALLVEYDALRARGKSPEEAMQKANAALDKYETEKFVPYSIKPPKQLMKILKMHRPADWP